MGVSVPSLGKKAGAGSLLSTETLGARSWELEPMGLEPACQQSTGPGGSQMRQWVQTVRCWLGSSAGWGGPRAVGTTPGVMIWACLPPPLLLPLAPSPGN